MGEAVIQSGVYAYRGRKPGARLRIPFLSYHWLYVGETTWWAMRDRQHRYGDARYRTDAKPWSDLEPRRALWIPLPPWKWLLRSVETVVIALLWPVYNVQKNRWNPRRIKPLVAVQHRALRRAGGRPLRPSIAWYLIILVAAAVAWYKIGGAA